MRLGAERVGRRGLIVLVVTGVAGLVLAVHGYGRGVLPASTAGVRSPTTAPAPTAPTTSAPGQSTTTSGPPQTTTSTAPAQKLGPLLSSTQYAPYAFRIYPGAESAQAKLATTGFHITVSAGPAKITVHLAASGSPNAQSSSYALGDRVYFVETTLGDDSGDTDYNLGDDGLLVTDPSGRIVQ